MLSFFQKENTFTLLIIFIVKSLQKEQNSKNLLLWPPICRNKPAITPKWFNSLDTNSTWRVNPKNVWNNFQWNELCFPNWYFWNARFQSSKTFEHFLFKIQSGYLHWKLCYQDHEMWNIVQLWSFECLSLKRFFQ